MFRQVHVKISFPLSASPLELDMGFLLPHKDPNFPLEGSRDRLPTKTYLSFGRPFVDSRCPRCQSLKTTIHILCDCPWVKEVWHKSLGILPLSFFQLPLQD